MALARAITEKYRREVEAVAQRMAEIMKAELESAFRAQGHNNTGAAVKSIEEILTFGRSSVAIDILMNDYTTIVNSGVSANRIPYQRGSGKRTSKYIQALIQYFKTKGLGDKEARGAAFATATKHKREGMPTRASSRFSQTGKRTGFLEVSRAGAEKRITEELENSLADALEATIFEIAKQYRA